MARQKSKGAYAPLAAQYYLDDAILEAGHEAELLYVRCLSFLASVPTDGFLTERQISVVGVGLRNVPRRVESLLSVGLLEASPGGFVARSWLKWNRSAAETDRHLRNDRERKARAKDASRDSGGASFDSGGVSPDSGKASPDSESAATRGQSGDGSELVASVHAGNGRNSRRNPVGFQTDSSPQYSTVQDSTVQDSTEEAIYMATEPTFADFWEVYPRKNAKLKAEQSWNKATKVESPDVIVEAARAYAESPHRVEKQFVPHGATWLNGQRWNDPLPEPNEPKQTARGERFNALGGLWLEAKQSESNQGGIAQ